MNKPTSRPKGWAKLSIVVFLSCVVLVGVVLLILPSKPPPEATLIQTFTAHRPVYERLRDMLEADGQVRAVYLRFGVETVGSGLPRAPSEVNFPVTRYNEYVALLGQIGSAEVFRSGDHSGVCNVVWAHGFGGDTRHVQICWEAHQPANIVASLTDYYQTPKPRRSGP
jgi:hypothetical protein